MSQDFKRNCTLNESFRKAYIQINTFLSHERSDIKNFQTMPQLTEIDITSDIIDKVFNVVITNERRPSTSCFYIYGPDGSGGTYIYTTLYHLLKSKGKAICTMAFTDIAAILLPHGITLHKTFGILVPLFSDSVSNIKNQSKDAEYLRNVDIFI